MARRFQLTRNGIGAARSAPVAASIVLLLAGCGDDGKRPLGASCTESRECASGRCVESVCVDPSLTPSGPVPVVAYVTRDSTGANISVIALSADGGMLEHGGSPFSTGVGNATEVAFTPDGAHAYVGSGSNGEVPVHVLDVAATDFFPTTNPNPPLQLSSGLKQWDALVIHPGGAFVFAADAESDGDRVYAYAVDSGDARGSLTLIDSSVDVFDVMWLDMDPLGRYLIAANDNRQFGIFDLEHSGRLDGTLGTAATRPTPDFVRGIRFGASGDALYLLTNTALHAFAFDRQRAELSEVSGSPFAMADGRVLEVDPRGRFLYEAGSAGVFLHRINPTGTVALVDGDGDELNGTTGYLGGFSDLAFGGDGAFLFATGQTTASFAVGDDGLLSVIATLPGGGDRIAVLSLAKSD